MAFVGAEKCLMIDMTLVYFNYFLLYLSAEVIGAPVLVSLNVV